MSNYDTIRDYVASCASMLYFQYHGKEGQVDPYSPTEFLPWSETREMRATIFNETMNQPFWDGKALADIAGDVTDISW